MNKTSFLELNKPSYEDLADINLLNQNLDRIDQEFKNINNTFYEQDDINITVKPNSIASFDSKISTKINPTIKGKFMQNLIDTHKCIYRVNGDTGSPFPKNITDNSMVVISYSSNFIGTGCFVGVRAGMEYTIKGDSLSDSYIIVYDANNLTTSNYSTKRITSVLKSKHHNFKFIAPSSGYVFIGFSKTGSDNTGTIISNLLCIEGDYTNKSIEWFKGVKPSDINIKSIGENLFDGIVEIGFIDSNGQNSSTATMGSRTVNYINVEPNTSYTISYDKGASNTTYIYEYDTDKNFIKMSQSGASINDRTIAKIITSSDARHIRFRTSTNFVGLIQNGMLVKGDNFTYVPFKKSILEIDDWLGDGDKYNNGLLTKSWRRLLLSEFVEVDVLGTYDNTHKIAFTFSNTVNWDEGAVFNSVFDDYIYSGQTTQDFKHCFGYSSVNNIFRFYLFIPKTEIDNLSGNNLNEKLMNWIKENDDYVYYQKANSCSYKPFGFDNLISYFGQTNIINNCNSNIDLTIQQNLCDANNKSSYISAPIKKRNIKINVSDWKNEGNIYTANIYDDITDLRMVDVSFNVGRDFENIKDISKHTQTFDGFVKIYSTKRIQKDLEVNLVIN